jgi:hypothetical protein
MLGNISVGAVEGKSGIWILRRLNEYPEESNHTPVPLVKIPDECRNVGSEGLRIKVRKGFVDLDLSPLTARALRFILLCLSAGKNA